MKNNRGVSSKTIQRPVGLYRNPSPHLSHSLSPLSKTGLALASHPIRPFCRRSRNPTHSLGSALLSCSSLSSSSPSSRALKILSQITGRANVPFVERPAGRSREAWPRRRGEYHLSLYSTSTRFSDVRFLSARWLFLIWPEVRS